MGVEGPGPLLFQEWHSVAAAPAGRGSGQRQSLASTGASEQPLREKPEPWRLQGASNSSMTPPFSSLRASFWPASSPSSQGTVQSFHCKGMVRAAQPRHPMWQCAARTGKQADNHRTPQSAFTGNWPSLCPGSPLPSDGTCSSASGRLSTRPEEWVL